MVHEINMINTNKKYRTVLLISEQGTNNYFYRRRTVHVPQINILQHVKKNVIIIIMYETVLMFYSQGKANALVKRFQ